MALYCYYYSAACHLLLHPLFLHPQSSLPTGVLLVIANARTPTQFLVVPYSSLPPLLLLSTQHLIITFHLNHPQSQPLISFTFKSTKPHLLTYISSPCVPWESILTPYHNDFFHLLPLLPIHFHLLFYSVSSCVAPPETSLLLIPHPMP